MKKLLSYLIILIGVSIMVFPKANEWYLEAQGQKLLETAELSYEINQTDDIDDSINEQTQISYERVSRILDQQPEAEVETEEVNSENLDSQGEVKTATKKESAPIAIIKIPKIDLKLPVLEGATKENMSRATTHMVETTKLGEIGNAAISAHRAHKKGRLFNRLNEVEVGDEIVIEMGKTSFNYIVYKISRVKPTDVSVLNRNKKDKILTLITCDPLVNPTHRLIVQAKIVE